jgi:hypothetical protein
MNYRPVIAMGGDSLLSADMLSLCSVCHFSEYMICFYFLERYIIHIR